MKPDNYEKVLLFLGIGFVLMAVGAAVLIINLTTPTGVSEIPISIGLLVVGSLNVGSGLRLHMKKLNPKN